MAYGIWAIEYAPTGQKIGQWVESFDPDGHDGLGYVQVTPDIAEAVTFPTAADAEARVGTQSTVKPLRPDGQPNRPLTAFEAEIRVFPER